MISARLATPVVGTHRPNFDMWGSLLPIWLSHVCSIPQSLKLKWLLVSSWEDTDGSTTQIRLEKLSSSEPDIFFVPCCCRKCKDLDVNMLHAFQQDHYPSSEPRYHAVVCLLQDDLSKNRMPQATPGISSDLAPRGLNVRGAHIRDH